MQPLIKQIIYILVTTNKKYNIVVIMDTRQGMHMFKEHFTDLLATVPVWLMPELKMYRTDRMIYGNTTIDFILNSESLIGRNYDMVYISEDVTDRKLLSGVQCIAGGVVSF